MCGSQSSVKVIRFSKVKQRDSQPDRAQHQQQEQNAVLPQAFRHTTACHRPHHTAVCGIHHGNSCRHANRRHSTDCCVGGVCGKGSILIG